MDAADQSWPIALRVLVLAARAGGRVSVQSVIVPNRDRRRSPMKMRRPLSSGRALSMEPRPARALSDAPKPGRAISSISDLPSAVSIDSTREQFDWQEDAVFQVADQRLSLPGVWRHLAGYRWSK